MYLLSLDASTKSTGFAIFKDAELLTCNCITASSTDLYKRIHKMVDSILLIVEQMNI
jgi:tRNA A37 threonylcarbamoyladenosine modification protein TsaB